MLLHRLANGNLIDFESDGLLKQRWPLDQILLCLAREFRYSNQVTWSVLQHSMAVGLAARALYPDNVMLIQHAFFHASTDRFDREHAHVAASVRFGRP